MRWLWPLLLAGAILLTPCVRGDPAISSPGSNLGVATWTFSNPANYTAVNATVAGPATSLSRIVSAAIDTTSADFGAALTLTNVNVTGGVVVIADTSEPGPPKSLVWQPDPANLSDNDLNEGNGGKVNYGTSPELKAGNWGGSAWDRSILQFPPLPLPSNATLVSANLQLYFFDPIVPDLMYFSAHRVTDNWTEMGSTWNTRDGVTLWNTTGGDFDPTALDTSAGVAATPGWFTWNITGLAAGWWTHTVVNDGLMIRQVGDTTSILGEKGFFSSDATNASARPRLLLTYTTPGSYGHLESRFVDAGGRADWGPIFWNATLPSGTSLVVRTRSGNTIPADASWGPWSAPETASGAPITSPNARYLQYSLDLFTPNSASPGVHDVSVSFSRYAATGRIETQDFGPASLASWGPLSLNASLPDGTAVSLEYSQDAGSSWLDASAGSNLSVALLRPIRLRILLATNDTTVAPILRSMGLGYRTTAPANGGLGGLPWESGLPWILALAGLAVVGLGLLAYLRKAAAFRPTGLFLIHKDGRLIARVGTEGMRDELAASAMFTLVLRFAQDSFQGPEGTGGELKSLEVDEREVSIARGRFLFLALVSEGPRPSQLPARMYGFLARLEAVHGTRLERWDGFREGNEGLEAELTRFLHKGSRRGRAGRGDHYRG